MTIATRRNIVRTIGALALCMGAACAGDDSPEKTPLGAVPDSASAMAAGDQLSAKAQAALEEGNVAYRNGQYAEALTHYNRAVLEAPDNASPYYGVLMAAQKTGNTALADSASAMIKKLSGEDASIHTGVAPANPHPSGIPPQN